MNTNDRRRRLYRAEACEAVAEHPLLTVLLGKLVSAPSPLSETEIRRPGVGSDRHR